MATEVQKLLRETRTAWELREVITLFDNYARQVMNTLERR